MARDLIGIPQKIVFVFLWGSEERWSDISGLVEQL